MSDWCKTSVSIIKEVSNGIRLRKGIIVNRTRFLVSIFVGVLGIAFIAGCADKEDKPAKRPNIIFLLTDDQRNDTLGCAGHPVVKTPNIDKLAGDGVRFENCFVTTAICAASRASIFTGLMERTHGYTFGKPAVTEKYTSTSYPALLKQAGYRTGFVGKYGCLMENDKDIFDFKKVVGGPGYFKQPDGSVLESTEVIGNIAKDFVDTDDNRPFCLSVSFRASHAVDGNHEPGKGHYPYPLGLSEFYEDQQMPLPNLNDPKYFDSLPEYLQTSMNRERFHWRWDTPEKYQTNMRAYYRMITGIDDVVGHLVKQLEEKGLADNTVIIYTADNGYYMGDRGFAGKWSHFEQSLRIPLIVYDPRLPKGQRGRVVEQTALNIDFAPTMLELAEVEIPENYEGRSLNPVVTDDAAKISDWRKEFFCEHLMDNPKIPKWEGVHTERYKYARYFEQVPVYEFLHDLKTDPTEFTNLVTNPDYKEVLAKMRSKVDTFAKENPRILLAENLQCEYKTSPLGIDVEKPRLGWTFKSEVRGQKQTAYQVIVSSSFKNVMEGKGDIWDSGKVSDNSSQVLYGGDPLKSATVYHWRVRFWDKDGKETRWCKPSTFETGLIKQSDWTAKWINDGKKNPTVEEDFFKFDPAPLFRKDFDSPKPIEKARLYITGLGYYEASLNARRVGDHMLDPGWTNYPERV
ncbi:MAG: sulfatase-like hydrolase/transferase, partial [Phycisphaerae bacterium]|nr:sulfatase-like hydrolase/transferase [Phycisphaerae bacterium]